MRIKEEFTWLYGAPEVKPKVKLTISELAEVVEHVTGIPVDNLLGDSQKKYIVLARHLMAYYGNRTYGYTLREIGEYLGGRDHSTMTRGLRTLHDLLDSGDNVAVPNFKRIGLYLEQIHEMRGVEVVQGLA